METIVGTVVVSLHNHGRFVADCIAGIVAAWREGLEILLVDDASCDDSYATAINILAKYPALPVTMMRTTVALGQGNAAAILRLARGRFIIQCDSDDVPMPDRFAEIMTCFADDPACRLVTSNAITISEDGLPLGLFDTQWPDTTLDDPAGAAGCRYDQRWLGATAAYHRDVFEAFPPLDPDLCPYGLDLVTPLRALLLGRHCYIAKPLVCYRLHPSNAHRVAGAYGQTNAQREGYQALMLLVLAQKLRDLGAPVASGVAPSLREQARGVFFTSFDLWAREATQGARQRRTASETLPEPRPSGLPAVPPIVTLRPGDILDLGAASAFAAVIGRWSGFHPAEEWGCWLRRSALVALRLAASGRNRLVLSLHSSPYGAAQRVSIRVGTAPWVEIVLAPVTFRNLALDLPDRGGSASIVPLIIVSHDAVCPNLCDADTNDGRLIGVALRQIGLLPVSSSDAMADETGAPLPP